MKYFCAAAAIFAASGALAQAEDIDGPFDGFYVGLHAGATSADFGGLIDSRELKPGGQGLASATILDETDSGFSFGAFAGGMTPVGSSFRVGFEVDGTLTDLSGAAAQPKDDRERMEAEIDFLASARLRAGYVIDKFMPYVTGGVGVVGYELETYDDVASGRPDGYFSHEDVVIGATAGAGAEYALSEHLAIRFEGLYYFVEDGYDFSGNEMEDVYDDDYFDIDDVWQVRGGVSVNF